MGDDDKTVSDGQFADWFEPAKALEVLTLSKAAAIREILQRARHGLLIGAAAVLSIENRNGERVQIERRIIDEVWWRSAKAIEREYDDFWKTGRIDLDIHGGSSFTLFGVKINPFDVYAIGTGRVAPSSSEIIEKIQRYKQSLKVDDPPYRAKPKVAGTKPPEKASKDELREWLRVWGALNPDAVYEQIESAAKIALSNRRITRQPLRDVIGELKMTKNRGNPTIRRN